MTNRILFTISGIVLILGGLVAFFMPFAAGIAATFVVGWTFIVAGALHIIEAVRQSEDRLWNGAFGLLGVLLGASFLVNPLGGLLSLTIILAALFLGSGAMQLYLAWKRRNTDSVLWMALSGVVSLALGVLMSLNIFEAAEVVPGIILAVELVTTGVGLLFLRPTAGAGASPKPEDNAVGTTSAVELDPAPGVPADNAARLVDPKT